MSNSSPTIFGDGLQTRDFVYVNDVVSANLLAMGLTGTYNVGTGVETSILGLTNSLKSIMLSKVDIKHVDPVKGELLRNVLDCSHLKSKGWKSNFDLDSGLRKTVEWFTLRP
jgi:UDP-glucose 4-epimerase